MWGDKDLRRRIRRLKLLKILDKSWIQIYGRTQRFFFSKLLFFWIFILQKYQRKRKFRSDSDFWRKKRPPLDGVFGFIVMKKKRSPLEGVFEIIFLKKKKASPRGCYWIQSFFEDKKGSPTGCFWIQSLFEKKRPPVKGVFGKNMS